MPDELAEAGVVRLDHRDVHLRTVVAKSLAHGRKASEPFTYESQCRVHACEGTTPGIGASKSAYPGGQAPSKMRLSRLRAKSLEVRRLSSSSEAPMESTASLLRRARAGDGSAREAIARRYLSLLTQWAHGRLPRYARSLAETDDLVQETLVKALGKLDSFEPRREGAFLAYLTQILRNRIRDEIRRNRPIPHELPEDLAEAAPSPLDRVLTAEAMDRYDAALRKLKPRTQEAVILFLEFGFSYPEIAASIESSANATRMLVVRALLRLSQDMSGQPPTTI